MFPPAPINSCATPQEKKRAQHISQTYVGKTGLQYILSETVQPH